MGSPTIRRTLEYRPRRNGFFIAPPSAREKNDPHRFWSAIGITGTGRRASTFIMPALKD